MAPKNPIVISLARSQYQELAVNKGEVNFGDTETSASVELKLVGAPPVFVGDATLTSLLNSGNFDIELVQEGEGITLTLVNRQVGYKLKKNKKGEEQEILCYTLDFDGKTDSGVVIHLKFEGDVEEVPDFLDHKILKARIKAKPPAKIELSSDQKTLDKEVEATKAKEKSKAKTPPEKSPPEPITPKVQDHETDQPYEDWPTDNLKAALINRKIDYTPLKKGRGAGADAEWRDEVIDKLREADDLEEEGRKIEELKPQ